MKKFNIFSSIQSVYPVAVAVITMAASFTACQEEDFGYTEKEIHAASVERHYNEEFIKAFGQPDPNQDWMCTPDVENVTRGFTRAAVAPTIQQAAGTLQIPYVEVSGALGYMKEGDNNKQAGKAATNFEYIAVETTTYDIYPTFWGRKFCTNNEVGVYWIDDDGNKHDLGIFWKDTNNGITAHFKDGSSMNMPNNTSIPIIYDQGGAWNNETPLYHKCSTCGGDGKVNEHKETCNSQDFKSSGNWNKTYTCQKCGATYKNNKPTSCTAQINVYDKCTNCDGSGKSPVDYYEFPHFTLTVPAGTKWGLYLTTDKTQNTGERITWYSNAAFNPDHCEAAATFSFGNVTYCSFEDAPHNLHNGGGTGNCGTCHYGHYDLDFNDIVLTITPRPIESTYEYKSVRVMCEDLGGTFDWDFNDIVYDLKFEQGGDKVSNATVTITLQAIGGTLPIHFVYNGEDLGELHTTYANQTPDPDGLFEPVNVGKGETIKPVVLTTINLGQKTMPKDYDFRQIVHDITLVVADVEYNTGTRAGGTASEGTVSINHTIRFPEQGADKTPQCFMTSTGTSWPGELQKITDRYPTFSSWVQNQKVNNWYNTNPNF